MKNLRNSRTVLMLTVLALTATGWAKDVKGGFSRTLQVTGAVELSVSTGAGDIEITTGDAKTVQVYGSISASDGWFSEGLPADERVRRIESAPPIQQNGNFITIGKFSNNELRRNVSISYKIVVPAATRVISRTGSGDQTLSGVSGPARLESGSGTISASNTAQETRANTGSGDIKLNGIKGRVYLVSGSGTIRASDIAGGMVAESGSGDIEYNQTSPGEVSARTGSGSIRLRNVTGGVEVSTGSGDVMVGGTATGNWDVTTGSGSIEINLPASAQFDVNARSGAGSVSTNHQVAVQGQLKANHLEGRAGKGGPMLRLSTSSGDIRVR